MAPLDPIIAALDNAGKKHRRLGAGIIAQCPSHPDRNPSLAITPKDGKTVMHCFAGCLPDQILADLNLTWADLFDEPATGSTIVDLTPYLLDNTPPTAQPATTATVSTYPTEYIYTDADGNPIGKKTRLTDADGKKTFRQYRFDNGQWLPGLDGIDLPLYKADIINQTKHAGEYLWIVEGEKDADTMTQLGYPATTMPNGAGSWQQRHTDQLQGIAGVYLIADNDEPGIKHALAVKDALEAADIGVRLLIPANGHKDITDHVNAGLDITDLTDAEQIAEQTRQNQWAKQLERLKADELLKQTARDQVKRELADTAARQRYTLPDYRPSLTDELAIEDEPLNWLIEGLWPEGANVTLTATYKAGKTSTVNSVLKALADRRPLFGDQRFGIGEAGRIAVMNFEVSGRQIREWIKAKNIINTDAVTLLNMRGYPWPMIHDNIAQRTIQWLADNNITTWVIDPLARAFVGCGDENSNADMGAFLDMLDYIKEQAGVKNLLICAHTGRNAEQGNNRARGASRFDDWADVRWMLTKDDEDERFFAADGRDVDIELGHLQWDGDSREQTFDPERKPKNRRQIDNDDTIQDIKNKILAYITKEKKDKYQQRELLIAGGMTPDQAKKATAKSNGIKAIEQLTVSGDLFAINHSNGRLDHYIRGFKVNK